MEARLNHEDCDQPANSGARKSYQQQKVACLLQDLQAARTNICHASAEVQDEISC